MRWTTLVVILLGHRCEFDGKSHHTSKKAITEIAQKSEVSSGKMNNLFADANSIF